MNDVVRYDLLWSLELSSKHFIGKLHVVNHENFSFTLMQKRRPSIACKI